MGDMDKVPNVGRVEHHHVMEITCDPCFEETQGVYYTERGFVGHFRLEQRGCENPQMLTMPIYEVVWVGQVFSILCGYTCTYLMGILLFDHRRH